MIQPPLLKRDKDGYFRVTWFVDGNRKRKSFGSNKAVANKRYFEWIQRWKTSAVVRGEVKAYCIADLYPNFRKWQSNRMGSKTGILEYDYAMKPLLDLYGNESPDELSTRKLKQIRDKYIEAGWSRPTINKRVRQLIYFAKWLVSEEYIGSDVLVSLQSVQSLRYGETEKESKPVHPAKIEYVRAAQVFMTNALRSMVEVHLLTGMRPGELCGMRWEEIDTKSIEDVWLYRPTEHKTKHHGQDRLIAIGPRAQSVIVESLGSQPRTGAVFPVSLHSDETYSDARSQYRPKQGGFDYRVAPSYQQRLYKQRLKLLTDTTGWTANGYYQAIVRACKHAGVPKWTPNQLRHLYATMTREQVGLEITSSMMGHSKVETTQIYAESSLRQQIMTAKTLG